MTTNEGPPGRLRAAFDLAGIAAALVRRTAFRRFPPLDLAARLAMLPAAATGLSAPLTLRFNVHHVPLVDAANARDGAIGLGIVHAHLRLAQMEVMRRLALGRVAEVVGPAGVPLDRMLRLIDFPRATAASLALMPPATRDVVTGFRDGINAVVASGPPPPEFEILGIAPQAWTVEDLFAVSRLCSADYSWRVWRTLSRLRADADWSALWQELTALGTRGEAAAPGAQADADADLATRFTPTGSNACALAGTRTRSGKPLLAADPHLVIATPNPWLIAGLRLPDLMVWGIMLPALPIFGMGRNDHGAWGGTNLHATSSELVDVAGEPTETRRVSIAVRGRKPRTHEIRESRFGPLVSDGDLFHLPQDTVALHWMGHRPSDEYSAFLALMRARDWSSFRDAVDGYGLPGLTMVWAGVDGDIGKMIACRLPTRPRTAPRDILTAPADADAQWQTLLTGKDLPQEHNPAAGFVASANDEPCDPPVTISHFFAAPHRVERLAALLSARDDFTRADMERLQADTYLAPAMALAQQLVALGAAVRPGSGVLAALAAWDGAYQATSRGALAFELTARGLVDHLEADGGAGALSRHWRPFVRLSHHVERASSERLSAALAAALDAADAPFARHEGWGDLHRLRLAHPLTRVPWLKARLPTLDLPSGGSNETLMKSAHPFTRDVHATTFGANARFIADLADPDETYAVLLGGQDGWPGSRTMYDMVGPFQRSDYLQLPRTPGPLAETFCNVRTIDPAPPAHRGPPDA